MRTRNASKHPDGRHRVTWPASVPRWAFPTPSTIGAALQATGIFIRFTAWLGCPAVFLVRCDDDGRRVALALGQTKDDALSLNLAHLRHEGAKRGANEVHIHLLADTPEARNAVEADLRLAAIAA